MTGLADAIGRAILADSADTPLALVQRAAEAAVIPGGVKAAAEWFPIRERAFGPAHLGRIQGAAQMLTVLASAIGPLIFAESARRTGSYFSG